MGHTDRALILTIDLGLSSCKSILFHLDGSVAAMGQKAYPFMRPNESYVEANAEEWWDAVVSSTREALASLEGEANVVAIVPTGQMHCVVPIDAQGVVTGPVMTIFDRRSRTECDEITDRIPLADVYGLTGQRLGTYAPAAKIRWFRKHEPKGFDRTACFLPCKDYIRYRMTRRTATNENEAAGTLLYDIRARSWSSAMLEAVGVTAERLPEIVPAEATAGGLTAEAASAMGLSPGIPVIVGSADDIELVGGGVFSPRQAYEHLGTTGYLGVCSEQFLLDPKMLLETLPHGVGSLWLVGGSTSNVGTAMQWAADLASPIGIESLIDGHLAPMLRDKQQLLSPLICLPYFEGERAPVWDLDARAAFVGISPRTTRADMARAVLEAIVLSMRCIMDLLEDMGAQVDVVISTGGGAQSRTWATFRASAYRKPIEIPHFVHRTSLGIMLIAGQAIGAWSDLKEAWSSMRLKCDTIEPNPSLADRIDRSLVAYREAYAGLAPVFKTMARGQQTSQG